MGKKRKHRVQVRWAFVLFASPLMLVALAYAFLEARPDQRVSAVQRPLAGTVSPPEPAAADNPAGTPEPVGAAVQPAPAESCDHLLVLVGPDHTLPPEYAPQDLVYLVDYGVPGRGTGLMLREESAGQLALLVAAAAAEGEELLVASGYRSYREQEGTFNWFLDTYGEDAGKLSVPPGQSQHQLGTAVDLTNSAVEYELYPSFAETSSYRWLEKHAADYGFVLAYPEGEEAQTGVRWEPWHYRYVGVENARQIERGNLSLQAFLTREGVLPRC